LGKDQGVSLISTIQFDESPEYLGNITKETEKKKGEELTPSQEIELIFHLLLLSIWQIPGPNISRAMTVIVNPETQWRCVRLCFGRGF
jgi:hypothetical protein